MVTDRQLAAHAMAQQRNHAPIAAVQARNTDMITVGIPAKANTVISMAIFLVIFADKQAK